MQIDYINTKSFSATLKSTLEQICLFVEQSYELQQKSIIELELVGPKKIKELNKIYLQKDYATDVLSFPYDTSLHNNLLGSIVINKNLALKMASRLNHSYEDEIALLFIHALLHIIGFDHESDNGEQREAEREIILHFNMPNSLILRNS